MITVVCIGVDVDDVFVCGCICVDSCVVCVGCHYGWWC